MKEILSFDSSEGENSLNGNMASRGSKKDIIKKNSQAQGAKNKNRKPDAKADVEEFNPKDLHAKPVYAFPTLNNKFKRVEEGGSPLGMLSTRREDPSSQGQNFTNGVLASNALLHTNESPTKEPKEEAASASNAPLQAKSTDKQCLVCCDAQPIVVNMPCGHGGICMKCGIDLYRRTQKCYLCQSAIEILIEIDPVVIMGMCRVKNTIILRDL